MKKNNILVFGLLVFIFIFGVRTADARTIYTTYKSGDKIKVNVNNSKQLDFYVIKNSDSENVTAIYDGVLGENFWFGPITGSLIGSIAESKLNELTSDWDNPSEIRLVKVSEINPDFELSIDFSEDFTEPRYYNIGHSYWTQDVEVHGDIYYPVLVTSWISNSNIHSVADSSAPSSAGAIRPVITISKKFVVGGTTTSEIDDLKFSFKYLSDAKNTYRDVYLNLESSKFGDNDYRALLSKTNSNIPETFDNDTGLIYMFKDINNPSHYTIAGVQYFEYAAMYGDVYLTIYEYDGTQFVKNSTPLFISRLDYLPYTYRIIAQFFRDKSAQFKVNDIHIEDQSIKFKIGEVTDLSLLSKFANPNNDSYEALLKYAKNDSNAILNSSITLNKPIPGDGVGTYNNIYDPNKVIDGKYYYVYTEIDTENGKYYPLNDVGLYISKENGCLWASNFKEKVDENPKTDVEPPKENSKTEVDKPAENPRTGAIISIASVCGAIILGSGGFLLYQKLNKKNKLAKI